MRLNIDIFALVHDHLPLGYAKMLVELVKFVAVGDMIWIRLLFCVDGTFSVVRGVVTLRARAVVARKRIVRGW